MSQLVFDIRNVNYRDTLNFRLPSEIGNYSVDGDRETNFYNDDHHMKWIYKPPSGWDASLSQRLDLNAGYAQATLKEFVDKNRMVNILKWMLDHQEKIKRNFDQKIDFVCSRGLLTKICSTPSDTRKAWCFCVSKFKSVIYMCAIETDQRSFYHGIESERIKLMTFWGAKFEQYMTSVTPDSKPNASIPVNENEGYYIVLKGQINGYNLLYSAEIDGKNPEVPEDHSSENEELKSTDCYIELKTENYNAHKGNYYKKKLLNWWLQSSFAGIPKIICGVRDDDGIARKLKTYPDETLAEICSPRDKDRCLKFCLAILTFVKECVQEDDSQTVYKFMYDGNNPYVKFEKLKDQILPEWFTAKMN